MSKFSKGDLVRISNLSPLVHHLKTEYSTWFSTIKKLHKENTILEIKVVYEDKYWDNEWIDIGDVGIPINCLEHVFTI